MGQIDRRQRTLVMFFGFAMMAASNSTLATPLGLDFLGEVNFPTGTMFGATEVGGLSAITFDATNNEYLALSDDQSQIDSARYYDLTIDLSDGSLDSGDVVFTDVTILRDGGGGTFPSGGLDPEGIVLTSGGQLFIASEGRAIDTPPLNPFVNEFSNEVVDRGTQVQALSIPSKYLPNTTGTSGVRNNLAFESLTVTPSGNLVTAIEGALAQDGPASDIGQSSPARILFFDDTLSPSKEFLYEVEPVPLTPSPPDGFRVNGLVELLAISDTEFLALERGFSVGVGNSIRLYLVDTEGATDISGFDSIVGQTITAVSKRLLLDIELDLGITPDNLEGMTFGPNLSDGRRSLILLSDNNFNALQTTQFLAFAVSSVPEPNTLLLFGLGLAGLGLARRKTLKD